MSHLLQDWVTDQADKRPDATAIVSGTDRLTYAELDTRSNQLAGLLKAGGCRQGDRVALLSPKSPIAIVGLLGIYKADCLYVPLDPTSPASRLKKILDSCENKWLLAAGTVTPALEELCQNRHEMLLGRLDNGPLAGSHFRAEFAFDDLVGQPAAPVAYRNAPHDPAHLLFTSGSTGTPKGVVITHANVISFVDWAIRYFGMTAADRVSAHPPLHFDLSFFDIFGAAAVGSELHLVPPELNLMPHQLADFIRTSELTQWFSVPSVLHYMAKFDVVRFDDFPRLKRLFWCGEVFPTPALIYWMQRLPHVQFTNLYGPTETTIASSYYTVPQCPSDPTSAIPIGAACEGEELLVLSESLQPLPRGETGDLCIGGTGLSPGYWRDPERTDAAFIPNPRCSSERIYRTGDLARVGDDGLVYFVGRTDSQIKSRGYRIELGEIEAALSAVGELQESAVVAVNTDGFEGTTICCAYVPAAGNAVTAAHLRRELNKRLPGYMLPARWLAFDQFPKNANGKTDRRRLKEAFEIHAAQTT
jgi:amino acid adenylation domain-containing protein